MTACLHPDFYSFTHRLKQHARTLGVDLLLVDAGDRVDGNGLVDAEPASPLPDGATSALDLFSHVPYDIVTTGNHELYKYEVAKRVGRVLNERFGDKFVVSNVNITTTSGDGTGTDRPYGNRVRKFETEQGRKVTAFGPLFDFKGAQRVIARSREKKKKKKNASKADCVNRDPSRPSSRQGHDRSTSDGHGPPRLVPRSHRRPSRFLPLRCAAVPLFSPRVSPSL